MKSIKDCCKEYLLLQDIKCQFYEFKYFFHYSFENSIVHFIASKLIKLNAKSLYNFRFKFIEFESIYNYKYLKFKIIIVFI